MPDWLMGPTMDEYLSLKAGRKLATFGLLVVGLTALIFYPL